MKKKAEEKSRIVTSKGGLAITRGCGETDTEREKHNPRVERGKQQITDRKSR